MQMFAQSPLCEMGERIRSKIIVGGLRYRYFHGKEKENTYYGRAYRPSNAESSCLALPDQRTARPWAGGCHPQANLSQFCCWLGHCMEWKNNSFTAGTKLESQSILNTKQYSISGFCHLEAVISKYLHRPFPLTCEQIKEWATEISSSGSNIN